MSCKYILPCGSEVILDKKDYDEMKYRKWHKCGNGYVRGYLAKRGKRTTIKLITFLGYTGLIDHKNRNRLDYRRKNLRAATKKQNNQNVSVRKTSKTGYRGVCFVKQKYRAAVQGKVIGYFDTAEKAARAYNRVAKIAFGEFANLNKIRSVHYE